MIGLRPLFSDRRYLKGASALASLRAESSPRSRVLEFTHRAMSLVLFGLLMGTGWVGLSYLKSEVHGGPPKGADRVTRNTPAPATPIEINTAVPSLVYAVPGDAAYYHTSGHLSSLRRRNAMSEDAALKKGLKPCPICMRR